MARHSTDLSGSNWQFGHVPRRPFDRANVYDLPLVSDWLPATVPGNVRTDLLALDRIPDPFFGENYKQSLWVEEVDWWYRRPLDIEPLSPSEQCFLIFEGIDYLSAIFIDGREAARYEGMFAQRVVDITRFLPAEGGRVELAVRLWGSSALPRRQLSWLQKIWAKVGAKLHGSWTGVYPDRSATLKCQMSFGWDFAPPIRTMGIWDEVRLVRTGSAAIVEASVAAYPVVEASGKDLKGFQTDPKGFWKPLGSTSTSDSEFCLDLTLNSKQAGPVEICVSIRPANFDDAALEPFRFDSYLPAGRSSRTLRCRVPQAKLWQPWDRGAQHLYNVSVFVVTASGQPADEVTVRTGVRRVELHRWQFFINGRREFVRGLNWVPADSFPGRVRRADYEQLLLMARDSGANLLRVWGGGLREKRGFYELCDALGLLVWQEFPFACMFLGSYPTDAAFLALVEAECGAIVRQLRSHPAVIVWCGGNEFSQLRNRPLLKTLARVVDRDDGTRPFIPTSPSYGDGHDAHNWLVWHGDAPISAYQNETADFLSEFGLQALPAFESLAAALPDPTSPADWESHHADVGKLERYGGGQGMGDRGQEIGDREQGTGRGALKDEGAPFSANRQSSIANRQSSIANRQSPRFLAQTMNFIAASQRAQAIGLQTAIERMRRRKGQAGGVCVWQFNEPWPAISWAIVDYFRRPKLAYRHLSMWYQPLLVSLNFPVGRGWKAGDLFTAEIWAINDSLVRYDGCRLETTLDGRLIHAQSLSLPPDSARCVGLLRHRLTTPPQVLRLSLSCEDQLLAENQYDLSWSDSSRGSRRQRLRRWLADWVMR